MKFVVRRTSGWSDKEMPCPEAQSFPRQGHGGKWYPEWYVDIESIDELIEFIKRNDGKVVIEKSWNDDSKWQIEIYDDYRE